MSAPKPKRPSPSTPASAAKEAALLAPIAHPEPLEVGRTVSLDPKALAALDRREVNVSEAFTIADASGAFFRASLKSAQGQALIYEALLGSPESPAQITLFCAVLARQRMITVTQKAAELGCVSLVPVLTEHSVQRGPALQKEKPWAWRGQALKGSRQCRRGSVMQVTEPLELQKALASSEWRLASARYVLDDRGPAPAELTAEAAQPGRYALLVGPEGGFSDEERAQIAAAGASTLRLGSRVLRAETAVFAGLAVLQHRLGDLR